MELTKSNEREEGKTAAPKKYAKEGKSCRLQQRLQILLELPLTNPQQKETLKNAGLPARYRDHLQLVAWNLYQKALNGDMAAIRELRGILEEGELTKGKGRKGTDRQDAPSQATVVIIDDVR
ncbi:MAG: hypothetical protein PHE47_08780 [Oscillospiraceae bacterium]|nr:hypothetical protein [Oscillospiraceae bacterium]